MSEKGRKSDVDRFTEADAQKSLTHERPDPKTKPPTEKPKADSSQQSSDE